LSILEPTVGSPGTTLSILETTVGSPGTTLSILETTVGSPETRGVSAIPPDLPATPPRGDVSAPRRGPSSRGCSAGGGRPRGGCGRERRPRGRRSCRRCGCARPPGDRAGRSWTATGDVLAIRGVDLAALLGARQVVAPRRA